MEDNNLLDFLEKQAKGIISIGQQHLPMAFIMKDNKAIDIVGIPFKNNEEKIKQIEALKQYVEKVNATKYFLILEGWQSTADEYLKTGKPPSQQENKQEILIISKFDKVAGCFTRIIPIIRKDNKISFGKYLMNGYHNQYTIFDVWHPKQVILNKE